MKIMTSRELLSVYGGAWWKFIPYIPPIASFIRGVEDGRRDYNKDHKP